MTQQQNTSWWFLLSTQWKISQNGSFPQFSGWKIRHVFETANLGSHRLPLFSPKNPHGFQLFQRHPVAVKAAGRGWGASPLQSPRFDDYWSRPWMIPGVHWLSWVALLNPEFPRLRKKRKKQILKMTCWKKIVELQGCMCSWFAINKQCLYWPIPSCNRIIVQLGVYQTDWVVE